MTTLDIRDNIDSMTVPPGSKFAAILRAHSNASDELDDAREVWERFLAVDGLRRAPQVGAADALARLIRAEDWYRATREALWDVWRTMPDDAHAARRARF